MATKPSLTDFLSASHGAFHISVVGPPNILDQDKETVAALASWIKNASSKAPGKGPICLTCDAEFTADAPPIGFTVATPFIQTDGLTRAVVSGLCFDCLSSENLKEKIHAVWREMLPDLREIDGGRS